MSRSYATDQARCCRTILISLMAAMSCSKINVCRHFDKLAALDTEMLGAVTVIRPSRYMGSGR